MQLLICNNQIAAIVPDGVPLQADPGNRVQWWPNDLKLPEIGAAAPPPSAKDYEKALDSHIEAVAIADRWESRVTCTLRAAYPNVWQAKAIAFGTWMDTCYVLAYQIMAEVQAGTRPLPTIEEFIGLMPEMEWPE